MTIPLVHTVRFLREEETRGHHPVRYACSDGGIYYCKYRMDTGDETELDFLWYELVGHVLLRQLGLPTPDVAFVQVDEGSFIPHLAPNNAAHMRPGVIAFGSKHMPGDPVNAFWRYPTKPSFKRLVDAEQLIDIALFDLWVANTDRGKPLWDEPGFNFNLLRAPVGVRHRLVTIDHAFILGGELFLRTFNPADHPPRVDGKLFRTPMFLDVMGHLGAPVRNQNMERCLTSLRRTKPDELRRTLEAARAHWPYPPAFADRVIDFLWDPARLNLLDHTVRSFFNQLP